MILLTGATGMLGGHLLWHLLQKRERVRVLKRQTSSVKEIQLIFQFYNDNLDAYAEKIEWAIGDVLNYNSLQQAMQGINTVYHCAAVVSFAQNPNQLLETNIQGTQNILNASLKANVRHFCFVSSIASLGDVAKGEMADEQSFRYEEKGSSAYSQSKYLSEKLVWEAIGKSLPAVIVNPGVILGAALPATGTMQLFGAMQKGLPVYTKGGSGYVAVEDVCKAILLLTEKAVTGERFVLVGENRSNQEVLNFIADALGKRRPFIHGRKFWLLPLAGLGKFIAKFFGKTFLFDRGTIKAALKRELYSSKKIQERFHFEFTPIEKCITDIARFYVQS